MTSVSWRKEPTPPRFGGGGGSGASSPASCRAGIAYHKSVYKRLQLSLRLGEIPGVYRLAVEPWLRCANGTLRQPDSVLHDFSHGIVIEVKTNWAEGREEKLRDVYLDAAKSAFSLIDTYPLVIVQNVRNLPYDPVRNLRSALDRALDWQPAAPVPVLLLP